MQKRRSLILTTFFTSLFVFFLIGVCGPTEAIAQKKAEPSLYERLGGAYNIATVVDDFIERLYVNDILNANPKIDEARKRVPKAGLKFRHGPTTMASTFSQGQATGSVACSPDRAIPSLPILFTAFT
jgi:hypothetical protein